jgi:hypothetical protein
MDWARASWVCARDPACTLGRRGGPPGVEAPAQPGEGFGRGAHARDGGGRVLHSVILRLVVLR